MGQMGWGRFDFNCATIAEILNAYDGFLELEEQRQRRNWEQAAMIAEYVVRANVPKAGNFRIDFPWYEKKSRPELTKEQIEHLSNQIDKAIRSAVFEPVSKSQLRIAETAQA